MSLLEGDLAAVFSSAFSGLFLDATLHRITLNHDGTGGGTTTTVDEAVKAQVDAATEAMRHAEGFTDTDQRIIVLAHGVAPISTDEQITARGQRWSIASVALDPAASHYVLHGRKA